MRNNKRKGDQTKVRGNQIQNAKMSLNNSMNYMNKKNRKKYF